MATWDEVKTNHRHVEQSVRIPMRADLLDTIASLELDAQRERAIDARENREQVAPGIAERIQKVEAELAASEVTFTFRAIGRRASAKLLADNPPTDAQKADAEQQGGVAAYNHETYPPAMLAASCVEPEGATVEDFADIWDNWSQGQITQLWSTCLAVNMGAADAGPKSSIASEILNGSARS